MRGASSACSSTRWRASSSSPGRADRAAFSIRAKADRIDLLEDGTLRVIDYKLGRAPKASRALQLPIYGVCAEQHLQGRRGRDWTVSRAGYVAFKEKHAFVAIGGSTSLERALEEGRAASRCGGRGYRGAGGSRSSPRNRIAACGAAMPASAARTTSATNRRVPCPLRAFTREHAAVALRRARSKPGAATRRRGRGDAGSRCGRAPVCRRPGEQRRARGVGRHREDVRARGPLRQPVEGRRRSRQHPGDHLHAQSRRRNARAHPARAACRGRALGDRSRAMGRASRSSRRHRHQHHRRVLPVAAARVSAGGGSRSRLRHGGRDRGAATDRGRARPHAAHPDATGAHRAGHRARLRSARHRADARRTGVAARAAAGRLAGARSLPRRGGRRT